jgi:hypothetical protein
MRLTITLFLAVNLFLASCGSIGNKYLKIDSKPDHDILLKSFTNDNGGIIYKNDNTKIFVADFNSIFNKNSLLFIIKETKEVKLINLKDIRRIDVYSNNNTSIPLAYYMLSLAPVAAASIYTITENNTPYSEITIPFVWGGALLLTPILYIITKQITKPVKDSKVKTFYLQ